MSMLADFGYEDGDTPVERDLMDIVKERAEEMEHDSAEKMLEKVRRMKWLFEGSLLNWIPAVQREVRQHLAELEAYFHQAIEKRDAPVDHGIAPDEAEWGDPFDGA